MSSRFPDSFFFGAATSAYQIEGAAEEDGREASIWDTFAARQGKVHHGDTGRIACDHYHRLEEDLDLIGELGLSSYRFSVSWPRVINSASGINQAGLDFYRRMVDGLHQRGVEPMVTLYHWDLPQTIQDAGGWLNRDTASRFAEFTAVLASELGDAVPLWVTLNEPFCSSVLGYLQGLHAPGLTDLQSTLVAGHHLLLGHARATEVLRQIVPWGKVGVTLNLSDIASATASEADRAAAFRLDGHENRWFLDPVLRGGYPSDMVAWYSRSVDLDFILDGDLEAISRPVDFLGLNYYETKMVREDLDEPIHRAAVLPVSRQVATAGGQDSRPAGLGRVLRRLHRDYTNVPIYITENGAAFNDYVDPEGSVNDPERIAYLKAHFQEVLWALADGVDVRGYYVWSLMDNFEWVDGYNKRFGIVYVDFLSQTRLPKASFRWYQQLVERRALQI